MKHQIRTGLLFCVLLLLASCASTVSMLVDVEKPAAVTLPVKAQNVIIVNNAVPQPMGYGMSAPSGKYPEFDSVYVKTLKTAPWQVMAETFRSLDDSKFFSDVSLYKRVLRTDNEWLAVVPVDEEIRRDFFENENFDLLISIDRLLFNSIGETNKTELGKMEVAVTFSAYLRDKDEPIVHTITDTLRAFYSDYSGTMYYNSVSSITPEEINMAMIRQASSNLGERIGTFFAPTWKTVGRMYYIRDIPDAISTAGYIDKGKWDEAKRIWIGEFGVEKKIIKQARLASNIAFAAEMNGEFDVAEEWAVKAKTFFQNASPTKHSNDIAYLEGYIKELQERQKNNLLLDKQYGISK